MLMILQNPPTLILFYIQMIRVGYITLFLFNDNYSFQFFDYITIAVC